MKADRLRANVPRTVENSRVWVGEDADGEVVDARTVPVKVLPGAEGDESIRLDMAGLEDLFPQETPIHMQQPEASTSQQRIEEEAEAPVKQLPGHGKVLITTSPRPSKAMFSYLKELQSLLGGDRYSSVIPRKNKRFVLSKVCTWAAERGYSALVVVGEDHKEPSEF